MIRIGYDLQKNTYSDQKFAEEAIEKLEDTTLLIDGAHFSEEIDKKAKARGIKMIPTNLIGGRPFRTSAAEESIKILTRELPELLVGAGTLLYPQVLIPK